jgi:bacillithiol system protein YtxJ
MSPRLVQLDDLESALGARRFLLFKHSPTCHVSTAAWEEYERFTGAHPELATGWIQVVRERALSQAVAARTGIRHESPQAILFVERRPVWNASHMAISFATLQEALAGVAQES